MTAVDQSGPSPRVDPSKVAAVGDPSSGGVELSDDESASLVGAVEAVIRRYVTAGGSVGLPSVGRVGWGASPVEIVRAVLGAACPVIAARVRAEPVADERQRIIELVGDMCTYRERDGSALPHPHPADHLGPCPYGQAVQRILAAGSDPVATPDVAMARDDSGCGWIAHLTLMPWCRGLGATRADALADLADAMRTTAAEPVLDALASPSAGPVAAPQSPMCLHGEQQAHWARESNRQASTGYVTYWCSGPIATPTDPASLLDVLEMHCQHGRDYDDCPHDCEPPRPAEQPEER